MAEDLTISHGEPQWDVKYNNLVNTVEAMGGVVSSLQWADFTDNGIVYVNGFQNIGRGGQANTGYRYASLGNLQIVELQVALRLMTDPGDTVTNLQALTLPDSIAPNNAGNNHALNEKYVMGLEDTHVMVQTMNGNKWWTGTESCYIMHIMYTTRK